MLKNLKKNYSPNFSTPKRNLNMIKYLIIHYTGMLSENKAINRLTDVNSKVSCHYFIKKNGQIIILVPEKYISWHAGKSAWKNYKSLNRYSIGIEIQNPGHNNKYENFNSKQLDSTIKICKYLKKKYNIKSKNILGHSDISYERKKDPGEKFPWKLLAKKKLSIWHCIKTNELLFNRCKKVHKMEEKNFLLDLNKIGYLKASSPKSKKNLIIAFQRRFRPELVSGYIDKECLMIANNLRNA